MRTIVFYVSGHGFGHASRDIEVINALLARHDGVRVIARTTAPQWLFDRTVRGDASRFGRAELETDTGVVQIDSLHLDEAATVARARAFMATFDGRVRAEAAYLRSVGASLAVADIPALGLAAASSAGIASAALGNFTWDWIYGAYSGAEDVVAAIGEAYRSADVALRLPMHGGFATFRRILDLPFVARVSTRDPRETRRALGWPPDERLVLISFGGFGLEGLEPSDRLPGYAVVGSRRAPLDESAMYDAGIRYEDIVRAVDVVVTKPGYGIVSECIANQTAVLYTSRGRFVEYDVLVQEIPRYLRARYIDHADLFAGRWTPHLDALLAQPEATERPRVDGAEAAAALLIEML